MSRIKGQRVTLREYQWEDLPDIRKWVVELDTTRMLGGALLKPQTYEQTEEYLRNILSGGTGANFVIAERESLKYLGQCNLISVEPVARRAEMAIVLSPQHVSQGYGYEAGQLLLSFAFEQMNLNRVFLKVFADNPRAIALYEKLGFRHEGCLREEHYRDGHYLDVYVMGILRREWTATN